jgi:RNA-directed DNA polymerase
MSIKFNDQLLLWGLGVIQPASPGEVIGLLRLVYPDVEQWPDKKMLGDIFENWLENRIIIRLNKKYQLYSLTAKANHLMDENLRRQRDKARVTLLRATYDASLRKSEVVDQDLDGESSSSEVSFTTKEGSLPVNSGAEPSRTEPTRLISRVYWERVAEQLNFRVGFDFHSSDIPYYHFRYCSFPTLKLLQEASPDSPLERDMSLTQLALAIGVSPRLLSSFTHKPENHYRTFSIGKRGGGQRDIASPRFFLKTIQYWIKSYVLCHLAIHESCHAYLRGKSIITNAYSHVGKAFVANIDIENFFGSISRDHVFRLLRKNDIGEKLSGAVANLVTYEGHVPQGAPTSPAISNALLFDFDEAITNYCVTSNLSYTRYADDMTISGDTRGSIESAIEKCSVLLSNYKLKLKKEKTRIASHQSSQRVTGLVVNEKIQPPREYQRRIRSMFHNAYLYPEQYLERINELRGHLSYLSSFDILKGTRHLYRYQMVLKKLVAVANKK